MDFSKLLKSITMSAFCVSDVLKYIFRTLPFFMESRKSFSRFKKEKHPAVEQNLLLKARGLPLSTFMTAPACSIIPRGRIITARAIPFFRSLSAGGKPMANSARRIEEDFISRRLKTSQFFCVLSGQRTLHPLSTIVLAAAVSFFVNTKKKKKHIYFIMQGATRCPSPSLILSC